MYSDDLSNAYWSWNASSNDKSCGYSTINGMMQGMNSIDGISGANNTTQKIGQ